jgi:hypothetical protein
MPTPDQAARPADDTPVTNEHGPTAYSLLETAWTLIANAGEGDWHNETADWRAAAERWADNYHAHLRGAGGVR